MTNYIASTTSQHTTNHTPLLGHSSPETPGTLQHVARQALESPRAHLCILTLVLVDLVIVLVEIGLSMYGLDHDVALQPWFKLLGWLSRSILLVFSVELFFKLLVFGWSYFLLGRDGWLHSFDAVIVWLSLIIELALHGKERELAHLLIILRLWRVVRVVDSVALSVKMSTDITIHSLHEEIDRLQRDVNQLRQTNEQLTKQLAEQNPVQSAEYNSL
ncbi:hypothetical protein IWQ61_001784 [Dispira simplex]|nr:hypothetical protein IWQ61_001784 [Dispira simplex]